MDILSSRPIYTAHVDGNLKLAFIRKVNIQLTRQSPKKLILKNSNVFSCVCVISSWQSWRLPGGSLTGSGTRDKAQCLFDTNNSEGL